MERAQSFNYLIGMDLQDAKDIHDNLRVTKEDDKSLEVTADCDETRLNVEVTNGKISSVVNFG